MKQVLAVLVMVVSCLTALSGCGSGGGSGTASVTVSGVAASGAPIGNAVVTLMDSKGGSVSGSTDANGNYSLNVTNRYYPFAIKVDWNDGTPHTLYSYAKAPGNIANINPLTSITVINASGASDLTSFAAGYFNSDDRTALTQVAWDIDPALVAVQTRLSALLTAFGANSTNPFSGHYAIGAPGLDKMFDLVGFDITGSTITIKNRGNSSVICSGAVNAVSAWTVTAANIPVP